MVHIKEPLLLIGKSSPCVGSMFPLLLSEWSFTICPTSYSRKLKNVLGASLNKTFHSLFILQIAILVNTKYDAVVFFKDIYPCCFLHSFYITVNKMC